MRLGDDSILPEDLPETITVPGVDYKIDVPRTTSWLTTPVTTPRWVWVLVAGLFALQLMRD